MPKLLKKFAAFERDERGVQLVELAIAIPVIVVLFAAVAEFGRFFETYTTLAKASRVAARYLATASATGGDDLSAKNLVVYGNTAGTGQPIVNGLTVNNVDIVRRNVDGAVTTGFPSTVTVQIKNYKHTPLFDIGKLTKSSLSLNVDVKPSVTMRYLMTEAF